MKKNFLMVERVVMESLGRGRKNRCQLFADTKLDIQLIDNILHNLKDQGLVVREGEDYILDNEKMEEVNRGREARHEVRELFVSWANRFFAEGREEDTHLHIKKVYMNEAEEILYREHLARLNRFLEGIKETSRREKRHWPTAKKKVIFWGHGDYQSLAQASLNAL